MESWGAIVGRPQGVRPSSRQDGSAAIAFLEKLYWIWGNNWSLPEELAMSPGPGPAPAVAATRMRSAGRLTLGDVAGDRVDLVAERMKAMKAEQLEEIKSELRLILEGLDGGHYVDEFLYLQMLVQGRDDLTPAILLSAAHRVQLLLLVAIKTRSKTFIDPLVLISEGDLADILLERRCENIDCLSALPAGGCQCDICTARKGFCRNCTCMICNKKFNFEIYSCLWFECDVCCHCTHTVCAMMDGGQIRAGRCTIKNGKGQTKTLLCCQSCQGMSELLTWVRELFLCFAPAWDKDSLSQQLSHVCKMFDKSEDPEERKFVTKCVELLGLLSSGKDKAICRQMLLQELQEMYYKEHMQEALEHILTDTSAEPIELSYAFLENITNDFSQEIGRAVGVDSQRFIWEF